MPLRYYPGKFRHSSALINPSTDHFQLCPETVDKVIPPGVPAEEYKDDIEDKNKKAKEHLQGGEADKKPE